MITTTTDPTDRQLAMSLASTLCPACEGPKKCRHTFCFRCYRRLPKPLQHRLYSPLGCGYAEAVADALQAMDNATFSLRENAR